MRFLVYVTLLLIVFLNNGFALSLENIKADFIQTISNDDGVIEYRGKLIATTDSMAYWEYITPMKKEIFVHKNQVIIYEPNLNQAIVSKKMDIDFMKIINSIKESKDGLISEVNNNVFHIFLKDDKPYKIIYTDELDNKIKIMLENVQIDEKINNNIFNFTIPEDTDVVFE